MQKKHLKNVYRVMVHFLGLTKDLYILSMFFD